ncbi:ABC transporter ATP-binding protein [Pyrodictium abyssi]|uniref:ABC transporter ATP-binding protein n=1 Tax=Pyrodictium abyssi TaxID=54256 RepID=A0ABM8IXB7_9CREN|nr:ABC transporter ATP-binding protein [Pyrodictium abyssi]
MRSNDNIFCLMGPNGAGKTTLVRILSTQLKPSKGYVEVLGYPLSDAKRIRREIAIMPQEGRPLGDVTPWEFVYWLLVARGWSFSEAKMRTEEVLKDLDLWEYRSKPCMLLSGGLRRRVLLAAAMATHAALIFLDEPTLGLDPYARRSTWELLLRMKTSSFLFVTTNLGVEAENISTRVALLERGVIRAIGSVEELKQEIPFRYKLVVEGHREVLEHILAAYGTRVRVARLGDRLLVYIPSRGMLEEIVELLASREASFRVSPIDLEDVFAVLTGGVHG